MRGCILGLVLMGMVVPAVAQGAYRGTEEQQAEIRRQMRSLCEERSKTETAQNRCFDDQLAAHSTVLARIETRRFFLPIAACLSTSQDESLRVMDWVKASECLEETPDRADVSEATIVYEVEARVRFQGEIYTGREIWTAHVHAGPLAASTGGMQVEDKGEAISIDLPDGRTIYLLRRLATSTGEMQGGSGGDLGFFRHCLDEVSTPQEQVRKSREFRGTCVVPLRLLMVTFSDPSDPETLSILTEDEQLPGSEVEFVELRVVKPPRAARDSSIVDELPWLAGMDFNDEVLEGGLPDHFLAMSPDLLYATDFIRE